MKKRKGYSCVVITSLNYPESCQFPTSLFILWLVISTWNGWAFEAFFPFLFCCFQIHTPLMRSRVSKCLILIAVNVEILMPTLRRFAATTFECAFLSFLTTFSLLLFLSQQDRALFSHFYSHYPFLKTC